MQVRKSSYQIHNQSILIKLISLKSDTWYQLLLLRTLLSLQEDMAEVVEVKAKVMEADRAEVTLRTDVRTVQTSARSVVTSADKRQSIVTKL